MVKRTIGSSASNSIAGNPSRCESCKATTTDGTSVAGKAKIKKGVSFNPNAYMYRVLHINEYSKEEVLSSWYTTEEFKEIKGNIKSTLLKMDLGVPLDEDKEECSQGLETYTMKGSTRKLQHRQAAAFAVFDEQDEQDELGYCTDSDERIADVYQRHTYASHIVARARGVQYRMSLSAAGSPSSNHKRPTLTRQGGVRFCLRRVLSKAA